MKITIQSIHFDADKSLLEHVETGIKRIDKFFIEVTHVEVFLKLDALNGNIHSKVAEIKVTLPGKIIFAKEESLSFIDSVDRALEHAVQQVKKHKDKIRA